METGYFYFIKDEYYEKFSSYGVMKNKIAISTEQHRRPCYYCFESDGFYWMIPISSRVEKYERIYQSKKEKNAKYDGIIFGYVNGKRRAFLVQNIIPVTDKYIDEQYTINKGNTKVTVNSRISKLLNASARRVIRLHKKGIKITLTDLEHIIAELKTQDNLERQPQVTVVSCSCLQENPTEAVNPTPVVLSD